MTDLFHIALPADWLAAEATGGYEVSTRGVTLAEEGFIHCSYAHQVEATANRFYGDLERLVLLHIDRAALGVEVVDERPFPEATQLFPHIYGPIPLTAVTEAAEWQRQPGEQWSFEVC